MNAGKRLPNAQAIDSARPEEPPSIARMAEATDTSADSPRTGDELSVGSSEQTASGTEEIVYKSDYPETTQVAVTRILVNYSSFLLALMMAQYFASGFVFLQMFDEQSSDLSPFFFALLISMVLKIGLEVYYSIVNNINSLVHYKSLMDSVANLVVYQAAYGYSSGRYSGSILVLYLVLNICLQFVKVFLFANPLRQNYSSYSFSLFESLTYLLIALKLEFPSAEYSWAVAVTLYTVFYYVFLYSSSAYTFFALLLTILYAFGIRNLREVPKSVIWLFLGGWVLLSTASSIYCFAYLALRKMLESGQLRPGFKEAAVLPNELFTAGFLMLTFSSFGFSAIVIANLFFKTEIIRRASNTAGKLITLKKYNQAFVLALHNVSGNFFKKKDFDPQTDTFVPNSKTLDDCVICQSKASNFLLKPCNHCVLCEDCTINYLEFQSKCPLCKVEIERALRIKIDSAKDAYLVDSSFKVSLY